MQLCREGLNLAVTTELSSWVHQLHTYIREGSVFSLASLGAALPKGYRMTLLYFGGEQALREQYATA